MIITAYHEGYSTFCEEVNFEPTPNATRVCKRSHTLSQSGWLCTAYTTIVVTPPTEAAEAVPRNGVCCNIDVAYIRLQLACWCQTCIQSTHRIA